MPVRHIVLAIFGVAVVAMGVYLFVQVRATPARADGAPPVRVTEADPPAPAGSATAHIPPPPRPPVTAPAHVDPPTPADDAPPVEVDEHANPKLDAIMDQANKAYDKQDYEEARTIAGKVLLRQPANIRMLRIIVSSACIEGDSAIAQKYYEQLPKSDRVQLKDRCDRYGVTFKEPAQ